MADVKFKLESFRLEAKMDVNSVTRQFLRESQASTTGFKQQPELQSHKNDASDGKNDKNNECTMNNEFCPEKI